MDWIANPEIWVALITWITLEVVPGIVNAIFTRPVVSLMAAGGLWSAAVNLGVSAWALISGCRIVSGRVHADVNTRQGLPVVVKYAPCWALVGAHDH